LDKELTTFEVATAVAFEYFAQAGADVVVVEVGLGGRLDATNVVHPLVSVITTIGHDHMHILGKTLAQIAAEKAGIVKPGIPVVSAPQQHAAMAVIERVCRENKAPLYPVGLDWTWRATLANLKGQVFSASGSLRGSDTDTGVSYKALRLPLLGKHQLRNAAVVLSTVQVLRQAGLRIDEAAVRLGLASVVWPARFEVLGSHPSFVVEGAHNVDSARCLADTLLQYFPNQRPWLLLGILADKDVHAILRQLLPHAQGVVFVRTPNPRAADPALLRRDAAAYPIPTEIIEDTPSAIQHIIDLAGADGLIVATGSFTTAAIAREAWLRMHNMPMPPLDPQ
jgi:dihydrofolate synthase/folylpolyglutamate synthase